VRLLPMVDLALRLCLGDRLVRRNDQHVLV
jgi:hypothetical protein